MAVSSGPDRVVAKAFFQLLEDRWRQVHERTAGSDVGVGSLVAQPGDGGQGFITRDAPVADFQRKVVEQTSETELRILEPVMDRDEVAVDVRIVIQADLRPLRPALEPVLLRHPQAVGRIPGQVVAQEDGAMSAASNSASVGG